MLQSALQSALQYVLECMLQCVLQRVLQSVLKGSFAHLIDLVFVNNVPAPRCCGVCGHAFKNHLCFSLACKV